MVIVSTMHTRAPQRPAGKRERAPRPSALTVDILRQARLPARHRAAAKPLRRPAGCWARAAANECLAWRLGASARGLGCCRKAQNHDLHRAGHPTQRPPPRAAAAEAATRRDGRAAWFRSLLPC